MKRIELELSPDAEIVIKNVSGSLHLKGWEQERARIDFPHGDDSYSQEDDQLTVSSSGDCLMRVPRDVQLKIERVAGNAHISGVAGEINLESVGGSLTLKRVGSTTIEKVSGNLTARNLSGDIEIEKVHGNATLRNVQGEINAKEVGGNLSIREAGPRVVAKALGNANLRLNPPDDANYQISCNGNAYCRIETPINANVALKSKSKRIFIHSDEGSQDLKSAMHKLSFGKGKAKVLIDAKGHIDFRSKDVLDDFSFAVDMDFGEDFGSVIDEISDQVGAQMEIQLEALNNQLESLSERMQVSGDRAVRKAQRKVEAAQRSLEKRMRARGQRGPRATSTGSPHTPFGEPVSEEERMKVLEMVQDKKISVEEAEILLATLEGREAPKKGKSSSKGKGK